MITIPQTLPSIAFCRGGSIWAMNAFTYIPHPRIENRKVEKPPKVNDERLGFNGLLGSKITIGVGTMWAAYAFCALAFVSLPQVISTHNATTIVSWIAQTFLQLVLLPIIIVGQNIQGKAFMLTTLLDLTNIGVVIALICKINKLPVH